MTAQHAPHTPQWRRFLSLPHNRLGWLAVGISGISLTGISSIVVVPFTPDPPIIILVTILSGLFGGLLAVGQLVFEHERSWLVWLALVPMALALGLPIAFIAQWLRWMLRHEVVPIVPTVLFLAGIMAVIAASHFLQKQSERYGLGGTISSVASLVGFALMAVGALIGRASQNWLLGTNLIGVGLWAATIGLAGLAIVTLKARVLPWWGGAALIAANPLLDILHPLDYPGQDLEFLADYPGRDLEFLAGASAYVGGRLCCDASGEATSRATCEGALGRRTSENSVNANFAESPECELLRILLPRTPVNKPHLINLDQQIDQYGSCQRLTL